MNYTGSATTLGCLPTKAASRLQKIERLARSGYPIIMKLIDFKMRWSRLTVMHQARATQTVTPMVRLAKDREG